MTRAYSFPSLSLSVCLSLWGGVSADNQDVPIWLVGTDGGLLRRPVRIDRYTHEVW